MATRTLAVLFLCAGIAFLGLLAGGDHPEAGARLHQDPMIGYYSADMPRYPDVNEIPAGRETSVGGAGVRMSFFTTPDDPAKVARHYGRFWRQRRFFVRDDITHVGGVVSAVDVEHSLIYQVLVSTRKGHSEVFPSVTRSPLRAMETSSRPAPVPLFPDSKAVITLASKEGKTGARIHLSTNAGTLDDNLAHYARELRNIGYRPELKKQPEKLSETHRVLLYRKGSSEVTINLTALSKKKVRVHIMAVGSK